MIVHRVAQNTPEWLELRRGIPTASEFKRIITPLGKFSQSSTMRNYAIKLATELLLNRSLDSIESLEWVAHGKDHEADAAKFYDFAYDVVSEPVGFITTDDGRFGASPDRLVGEDGLLEIKCPAPATHVGYLVNGFDLDYKPQVQGQLLVSGRAWCDWMSYSYEMPQVVIRVERDEDYIAKLQEALVGFCVMKDALLEEVMSKGFFAKRERYQSPVDAFVEALKQPDALEEAFGLPPLT